MRPSLFCKVCKQDHSKPLAMPKWCDRSELEIKYDQVWDEYIKLTNVLEIAESQISTAVKYLKDDGSDKLENTEPEHQMFYGLSYALSQIEKIKKG